MLRVFVPNDVISDKVIAIRDIEQLHYLKDVLRLKKQDKIIVVDEQAIIYSCQVAGVSPNEARLEILEKKKSAVSRLFTLTVACAMPKNSRFDDIVDKLTQLGVDRIIPLKTARVIADLNKKKEFLRLQRWLKIARQAAQQSQRDRLACVEPITDFSALLGRMNEWDLKLIPALIGKRKPLRDAVTAADKKNILLLIGPEGDFTPQEVEQAIAKGCIAVSLGSTVLRVETAAVAAAAYIRLAFNAD